MCSTTCFNFGKEVIKKEDVTGKAVIEVGSLDVNGSLRSIVTAFHPGGYVGIDIDEGPGVDEICNAEDIIKRFGKEKFDLLICTELLEHVKDWQKIIHNFKQILKPSGIMIVTTRSKGCFYHGFPYDYWRYELSDMKEIFSDFIIEELKRDISPLGVFVKAKKPNDFVEKNLKNYPLYSIVCNKRCTRLPDDYQHKHALRLKFLQWTSKYQSKINENLPLYLKLMLRQILRKMMFE